MNTMCVLTLNQNISDSTDSWDKTVLHFTVGHGLHKYKYIQIWWLNIVFSHVLLFISKVILVCLTGNPPDISKTWLQGISKKMLTFGPEGESLLLSDQMKRC